MLNAIKGFVLQYLVAGLAMLLGLSLLGLGYQHFVIKGLRTDVTLTAAARDLAQANVAVQNASIQTLKAEGEAAAERVRAAEGLAQMLAAIPKPLPPAPKGCAPAAAWARAAATKSAVLEHWND